MSEQLWSDERDHTPEIGANGWALRRGFEIATAYGSTWDEAMEQADDIAATIKELRDTYEQRIADLTAEVERLRQWVPVGDGYTAEYTTVYGERMQLMVMDGLTGPVLSIVWNDGHDWINYTLPDSLRLFERKEVDRD